MKSIADYIAEWKSIAIYKNQTYADITSKDDTSSLLAELDPEQQRIYNDIKESDMRRLRQS